ncbi:MAG: hypothetical protein CM1200mP41_27690 [Gammaproteobacteria bacterium]|nr:MAG: hypothetical protein CM1200mP41_27690 [Gammaproteobacteria bacterium]
MTDAPDALDLVHCNGAISFDQVSFHYTPKISVLERISFSVSPGEKVAIVGPTGSGKSTTAALLRRFYDPLSGQVCIDGHDLRTLSQATVGRHVSMVFRSRSCSQALYLRTFAMPVCPRMSLTSNGLRRR